MLSEISERLKHAIEKRRQRDKIARDLEAVQRNLDASYTRLNELQAQLDKEKVDLDNLERLSLPSLFYTVLRSRAEQIDKERQELLRVNLKFQQAKHQVTVLESERGALQRSLQPLTGIDREYQMLLAEKEHLLRQPGSPAVGELLRLAEQDAGLAADLKELDEAVQAGSSVLAGLEQVTGALQSAQNWGVWDMLGGGLISTMVKHSRIDDARQAVHHVQDEMTRFSRELADVRRSLSLSVEIGALESFADYFFDGLIFDWVVQSRINTSLDEAHRAAALVAEAVQNLQVLKARVNEQRDALEKQRSDLIERS